MKILNVLFATAAILLSSTAISATRYVSDNIYTYLHSGPSSKFRIIGTVRTGEKIKTLSSNKKTKFTQIKTLKGKIGWIQTSEVQNELPAKLVLPTVQEDLKTAKQKLKNIHDKNKKKMATNIDTIDQQDKLIADLKNEKVSLQKTIMELKEKSLELDLLQSTKKDRVKMEWMINGGGVLLFGLIIGLILPFIPRRKKRQENW